MEWSKEAQRALSKVPFFVRNRVKKRVEEEAMGKGAREVNLEHVQTCKRRFLSHMEEEVRGYQVETCFGQSGCPNRAVKSDGIPKTIEKRLSERKLKTFLKKRVEGPLKMHHEFRVSVSECPNACSRPQIVDLGLIGACEPRGFRRGFALSAENVLRSAKKRPFSWRTECRGSMNQNVFFAGSASGCVPQGLWRSAVRGTVFW